jgi:hypothetical protein
VYNVATRRVGMRVNCKKCGAALIMGEQGLELADAAPAPEPYAPFTGVGEQIVNAPDVYQGGSVADRILADLATWAFGIGVVLVILFLFFPVIDFLKISRASVAVDRGDAAERRADMEMQNRSRKEKWEQSKIDDEQKKRTDAKDKWEKEKLELQEDVESATFSARSSRYWYTWGMMFGFLFLGLAALGYLKPNQPPVRRVTGSVVICGMVLLIIMAYIIISTTFSLAAK